MRKIDYINFIKVIMMGSLKSKLSGSNAYKDYIYDNESQIDTHLSSLSLRQLKEEYQSYMC